ncbi:MULTISPECIES: hypothetical protein [Xanthomonas]|uniref:Uncharacterized protein n=1 Tax=Xanthomonas dyei TaxID=743699 RepID=A0ABZ0D3F5_9XANT|nr:hypothetical protein [Xanthomonas dyei]WOB24745.1 hypothetical protein NYR99_13145 [Xanthomonas dyei]WOB52374.1 hypothetical protein NYR95_13150 [Xanthomonas dyei]
MMGSPSSGAATEAAQADAWRQNNISRAVGQINSAYGSAGREADINDFLGASRSFYRNELDRQKDVADRSLKFAMARNGQTGGSTSVDASRLLGENFQTGVLSADRLAQGAANNLRTADEQARMSLISQAQSGMDMTGGASQAAAALRNNLQGAQAGLKVDALGDVFGGIATIAKNSRDQAAERRGFNNTWGFYQPGFGQGTTR